MKTKFTVKDEIMVLKFIDPKSQVNSTHNWTKESHSNHEVNGRRTHREQGQRTSIKGMKKGEKPRQKRRQSGSHSWQQMSTI